MDDADFCAGSAEDLHNLFTGDLETPMDLAHLAIPGMIKAESPGTPRLWRPGARTSTTGDADAAPPH
jgi:hypothetical protein